MENNKTSRVLRFDSIVLNQTYFTDEGYLVDHPIVTSTGIFEYTNPDGSRRRELRLPEDVFSPESLKSYKGKPVIITHDAGYINKDNAHIENIGTILSDGYRDADNVRAEIIIHDTDAMKKCGLRELSLGYNLRLEETSGEWMGQHYDAIQRDITINHLALVTEARAGEQARLNIDSKTTLTGGKRMDNETKTNKGMSSEELAAAVEAYRRRREERMGAAEGDTHNPSDNTDESENPEGEKTAVPDTIQTVKDRRDRRDSDGEPDDLETAMGIIAGQDEDIDTLLGVIDVLQSTAEGNNEENTDECEDTVLSNPDNQENTHADSADSKDDFRELLRVVRIGDRLRMDGMEMMSVKDAKKAVLRKLKPALRLDNRSTAYINAAFDMAVGEMDSRKDTNYQRRQMTVNTDGVSYSKASSAVGSASEARRRMIDKRMKKEDK